MPEITIYTTNICPYCVRAKMLLDKKGASYKEVSLTERPELRDAMIERAGGRRTVPQIFIGEVHVGGCDDLYELEMEGKLDPLLQSS